MTSQQAKQILLAYRPWANDADDPELAEALALCRADAELAQWFEKHCTMQTALRAKLQGIKTSEGLLQQIVSERRALARVSHQRAAVATRAVALHEALDEAVVRDRRVAGASGAGRSAFLFCRGVFLVARARNRKKRRGDQGQTQAALKKHRGHS